MNSHPATSIETLANGLTLIALPQAQAAVVTADIWVRSGARTEPFAYQGISHFLEHLVFKGTERLTPGKFDYLIEARGGATNAATSMDFTHYYITVANHDLTASLPLLADLVTQAAIPAVEFEPERLVVLEEIRRAQDNPERQIYQTLASTLYGDHPYARPVLGEPEHLWAMSADIVRDFHRARYQPQAMTVVLAGGLTAAQLLEAGRTTFAGLSRTAVSEPLPAIALPTATTGRFIHPLPRLQQNRMILAWLGPAMADLAAGVALEFISTMLTTGRTARLVRLLREEKGWARQINSYFAFHHDPGLFVLGAQVETPYLEASEELMLEEIQRLCRGEFTQEELERARRLLVSEWIFGTETPSQTCTLYGYYSTVSNLDQLGRYRTLLDTLSAIDIQQAAQTWLASIPATLIFTPE